MRFQNNILEFDKNGTRYAQPFSGVVCDAFILDPYNSFKLTNGDRTPMTDEEIKLANDFVNSYQPVVSLAELKIRKKSDAKTYRQMMEGKGIVVNNMKIATDRDSQSMITSTFTYLSNNPTLTISWKGPNGFVPLGLAEIAVVANAVGAYIQGLFNNEQETVQLIDAATTEDELNAIKIRDDKRAGAPTIPADASPVV